MQHTHLFFWNTENYLLKVKMKYFTLNMMSMLVYLWVFLDTNEAEIVFLRYTRTNSKFHLICPIHATCHRVHLDVRGVVQINNSVNVRVPLQTLWASPNYHAFPWLPSMVQTLPALNHRNIKCGGNENARNNADEDNQHHECNHVAHVFRKTQ